MVKIQNLEITSPIQEYIKAVKKEYNVEKVFLFGSYVSGKATKESDIDLAVISSSFSGNRFNDNVNVGKLTWEIDTRIEPITFRPEDFNLDSMIACEIIKTGLEIPIN
jgi:predicted nucleotidyltransferase